MERSNRTPSPKRTWPFQGSIDDKSFYVRISDSSSPQRTLEAARISPAPIISLCWKAILASHVVLGSEYQSGHIGLLARNKSYLGYTLRLFSKHAMLDLELC